MLPQLEATMPFHVPRLLSANVMNSSYQKIATSGGFKRTKTCVEEEEYKQKIDEILVRFETWPPMTIRLTRLV